MFYRLGQHVVGWLVVASLGITCAVAWGEEGATPPKIVTNSTGMKLVLIPAGTFKMGSPVGQIDEETQHQVTLTKPYFIGATEVTQSQWSAVMESKPWQGTRYVEEGADYPATLISWEDATEYCKKLSGKEGKTYRLPTEAEWEYACQAGSTSVYSFVGDKSQLTEYAWIKKNTWNTVEMYAHKVGQKRANAFGLYDMHGNEWEWCSDWYDGEYYRNSSRSDPTGPASGYGRVYRGGGWLSEPAECRSANRGFDSPSRRIIDMGFRVVCEP